MLSMAVILRDGCSVALCETPAAEFCFDLKINGKTECSYDTFEHAWVDFGRSSRCENLEEVRRLD